MLAHRYVFLGLMIVLFWVGVMARLSFSQPKARHYSRPNQTKHWAANGHAKRSFAQKFLVPLFTKSGSSLKPIEERHSHKPAKERPVKEQ